jgi:molybdate transport system substrate-binding protein
MLYTPAMVYRLLAAVLLLAGPLVADTIRVSAAISLKEAIDDAAAAFKRQTGHDVETAYASSGSLASQIERGAPADVFLSAAQKQIDQLQEKKAIDADTVVVVARNELVLIAAPTRPSLAGFAELASPAVRRVAIGEPRTVPAGEYAMATLEHLKLAEPLKDKLVYGANVRQVLDYVRRGEAAAGLVYRTDALAAGEAVTLVAAAPAESHPPIVYPGAVVSASKHKAAAKQFLDFLRSPDQQAALAKRGFAPADAKP